MDNFEELIAAQKAADATALDDLIKKHGEQTLSVLETIIMQTADDAQADRCLRLKALLQTRTSPDASGLSM